jgi:ABC-type phosphate/phosphonate transport system ATPase subunit
VLKQKHAAIIGDPGSGKTTFVRYIVYLLGKGMREKNRAGSLIF